MNMKFAHTDIEKEDIRYLWSHNKSAKSCYKKSKDWTAKVDKELRTRLNGQIPRNWVVNIRGLIGTPSGIFKSALGLNLARNHDHLFKLSERLAFSPEELNIKIQEHAWDCHEGEDKPYPKIFFLDEQLGELKVSQMMMLQNTIESCREIQMCVIACGIPKRFVTFSTFLLERFDETDDSYLPDKTVRYLVRSNPEIDNFAGFYVAEIPNLTKDNILTEWGVFWEEYMTLKREHQKRVVTENSVGGFNANHYAVQFLKKHSLDTLTKEKKDGSMRVNKGRVGMLVRKEMAQFTIQEKKDVETIIIDQIEEII